MLFIRNVNSDNNYILVSLIDTISTCRELKKYLTFYGLFFYGRQTIFVREKELQTKT